MLTPSFVAAVDVLIHGQALSTQAHRTVVRHLAICPLVDVPLFHLVRICARCLSSHSGQVFPSSNVNALSCKVTQTSFTTGHNRNVFQSLRSCWQPRHANQRLVFFMVNHFKLIPFSLNMLSSSEFTSS